ncbi:MAG: hypothetical protein AAGD05_11600, partial [Bacteroidota bacterium]
QIRGVFGEQTNVQIEIYQQNGQLLYRGWHEPSNGNLELSTDALQLPPSSQYFIKMKEKERMHFLPFFKTDEMN